MDARVIEMNPNGADEVPATAPKIRVFVVEDSKVIRQRLFALLTGLPGVEIVGDSDTAADAILGITDLAPDIVVLDIKLKNGSGIEVLRTIRQRLAGVTVIMLTNYATDEYRKKCLDAGADYFLDKTNEFERLAPIFTQFREK